jgi:hypothetical protein
MRARVICFSASDGAAGGEIVPLVAERTGFRVVDEQVIARAADTAGVEPSVVAGVEQRKGLAGRILEQLPAAGIGLGVSGLAGFPAVNPDDLKPYSDQLRGMIRSAIEELADEGDVLIVAHAASFALGSRPDVLRVFATAPAEVRAERVAAERSAADGDAKRLVATGDRNRTDYLKRFYGIAAEQPVHYDLVLNTEKLSPEAAAELVVAAAGR